MPAPKTPQYRFRGSIAPDTAKPKAELVAAEPEDGVLDVYLYDVIDSYGGFWGISASEFVEVLNEHKDVTDIQLHINSPGGEVFEGVAILNALRRHSAKVTAHVDGLAASAASFIAAGCDEVVMGRNTQLMIHDAWGICIGPAEDMLSTSQLLDKLSDNIASVYADKAGSDVAGWRAAMLTETWYSADEAVEAGLADKVDGVDDDPADPTSIVENSFDLSMFKHAGRDEADSPAAARVDDGTKDRQAHQDRRHRMNARKAR